jgi:hypothetical protein
MYALIALYLGFAIYLIIFLRCKNRDFVSRKITIFLAIKLLLLTIIYLLFFSDKMSPSKRQSAFEQIIFEEK